MNIEMPNDNEKATSISAILNASMPEKRTLSGEVGRLVRCVGIKYAFRGVWDAVTAALLVSITIMLTASFFAFRSGIEPQYMPFYFTPVMFFTPILYFSLLAFTSWKERMCGTWQALSVCRYNLKYLTAIRVIVVSAAGILFVPLVTLPLVGTEEYLRILVSAFTSMLFYAVLTLLSLLISESQPLQLAVPVLWILTWGMAFIFASPPEMEKALSGISAQFIVVAAVLLLLFYLIELRIFIMRSTRSAAYAR